MSFFKSVDLRNEILDLKAEHERAIQRVLFASDLEKTQESREKAAMVAERDAEILRLENKISRLESEMEARLKLQEDIHLDELLAVEDKFKSKLEAYEIAYKAKDEALDTEMHADKAHREKECILAITDAERDAHQIRAAAQVDAKNIIMDAYMNATTMRTDIHNLMVDLLKKAEVPYDKIQSLIVSATENYPSLSDMTVSSTSSSK